MVTAISKSHYWLVLSFFLSFFLSVCLSLSLSLSHSYFLFISFFIYLFLFLLHTFNVLPSCFCFTIVKVLTHLGAIDTLSREKKCYQIRLRANQKIDGKAPRVFLTQSFSENVLFGSFFVVPLNQFSFYNR